MGDQGTWVLFVVVMRLHLGDQGTWVLFVVVVRLHLGDQGTWVLFVVVMRLHLGDQGTWVLFPIGVAIFVFIEFRSSCEIRRSRREAAHSLPSSVEVMNAWMCTCSPPYVFMACRSHLTFFTAECFVARKHA